jgi:hypothetical protein
MNGPAPSRFPLFPPKPNPLSKAATPFGLVAIVNSHVREDCGTAFVPSASRKAFTPRPKKGFVSSVLTTPKHGGRGTAGEAAKDQSSVNPTDLGNLVALRASGKRLPAGDRSLEIGKIRSTGRMFMKTKQLSRGLRNCRRLGQFIKSLKQGKL